MPRKNVGPEQADRAIRHYSEETCLDLLGAAERLCEKAAEVLGRVPTHRSEHARLVKLDAAIKDALNRIHDKRFRRLHRGR